MKHPSDSILSKAKDEYDGGNERMLFKKLKEGIVPGT